MGGYAQEFLTIAGFHLLAVASPGPDFALILAQSIRHGRRTATWSAIGIGSGILVHVAYTVVGLGLVIRSSPIIFRAMQYTCAAYLVWLGWRAIRARPGQVSAAPAEKHNAADATRSADKTTSPASREASLPPSPRGAFATGFLTNALNPKATLFFISLFSVVVSPTTPAWVQTAYGLWMAVATAAWFTTVGWFFTRDIVRGWFLRCGHWFDRVTGALLIGLAVRLALADVP